MNILMIMTDQMHKDAMGFKRKNVVTPNIDRLAEQGVVFDHCYANSPVCGPYRGNLFTGIYTRDNGVLNNNDSLPQGVETLADSFNQQGYETSFVGKWHLGGAGNCPIPQELRGGFKHFIGYQCYNGFLKDINFYNEANEEIHYKGHRTDVTTDIGIGRLKMLAEKDKPFLHVVFYQAPHYPEQPSPYYEAMYAASPVFFPMNYQEVDPFTPTQSPYSPRPIENDPDYQKYGNDMTHYKRLYNAMVTQIDTGVGRLMATLEELGIDDETVILFSSDHGDMQGSHGLLNKCLPYEESCGIPLIVNAPGAKAGTRIKTPVSCIDYYPTCLELAGLDQVSGKHGHSLAGLIEGKIDEEDHDYPVFSEILMSNHKHWVMVRDKRYKLVVTVKGHEPYLLFDLWEDPVEMTNLVELPAYKRVVENMLDLLNER